MDIAYCIYIYIYLRIIKQDSQASLTAASQLFKAYIRYENYIIRITHIYIYIISAVAGRIPALRGLY